MVHLPWALAVRSDFTGSQYGFPRALEALHGSRAQRKPKCNGVQLRSDHVPDEDEAKKQGFTRSDFQAATRWVFATENDKREGWNLPSACCPP
jgi:hypothetical protein